jgi:hypothetical protein
MSSQIKQQYPGLGLFRGHFAPLNDGCFFLSGCLACSAVPAQAVPKMESSNAMSVR